MDLPCPTVLLVVTNSSHLQLPRVCCWSTAFPGRAVPEPPGASSSPLFPSSPARSTASLDMADGGGKTRRRPKVFKPLIKDLEGQQGRLCPAVVGTVNVFWVHSGLFFFPPACGPGTFKSKQGEGPCSPCPPNSRTTSGAAMVCTCRNGFFRADTDPADSACTSESCSGQGREAREAVEVLGVCVWDGGVSWP